MALYFSLGRAEHLVLQILADHLAVGRHHHRLELVDLLELVGFRVRRAGHAGKLLVHAEVVLEGDRGERLVLRLDPHAFLRFDALVQTVGPATPGHQTAGEFVDDDDFAVLDHVVLVPVVKRMSAQRHHQVVDQRDVRGIVEARTFRQQPHAAEDLLGMLVARFRQVHLMRLLVHPVVAGRIRHIRLRLVLHRLQHRSDRVHLDVEVGVILRGAADYQRRASLVDQDRVDLVDDPVEQLALHPRLHVVDHVVAQVVEAVFVVGPVGDVRGVGSTLLVRWLLRDDHADSEAEEAVDLAHPAGVATGKVVVDRHDVDAAPGKTVQVDGQRGRQRLALAGTHLCDLAVVQDHAADQLHVEVAHAQRPLRRLAADGECLRQQVLESLGEFLAGGRLAGDALAELGGLGAQRVVRQRLEFGLERVDLRDGASVLLQEPLIATAEDAGQDFLEHVWMAECGGRGAKCASAALQRRAGLAAGKRSPRPLPSRRTKPKMVSRDPAGSRPRGLLTAVGTDRDCARPRTLA